MSIIFQLFVSLIVRSSCLGLRALANAYKMGDKRLGDKRIGFGPACKPARSTISSFHRTPNLKRDRGKRRVYFTGRATDTMFGCSPIPSRETRDVLFAAMKL